MTMSKQTDRQAGVGLVEVMVALVIGLVTVLVIMQLFSVFEGDKRTTMGGADAQTNGGIALYTIKRQAAMAGFGLPVFSTLNPPLLCNNNALAFGGVNLFPIALVDGGNAAGASDRIQIRYGSSTTGGVPVKLVSFVNPLGVNNSSACQAGDVALVSTGNVCAMTSVTAVPDATHITLAALPVGLTSTSTVACLGRWSQFSYAVNAGRMELTTTVAGLATVTPSVDGIVNIQAQYGVSATANSNIVNQWVDATGVWANPDIATRNRIKAIRVAVVARSDLFEQAPVTNACSALNAPNPTGLCAWAGDNVSPAPAIDLSNDLNWQRYRYKVYETVIPLRNVIWTKGTMTP